MATEPRAARAAGGSALEWRLYLATALAAIYTAAWLALIPPGPAPAPTAATGVPADERARPPERGAVVWLDDLPPGARPAVRVPPGWTIVPHAPGAVAASPRVVRVAPPRSPTPVRIRTRSS